MKLKRWAWSALCAAAAMVAGCGGGSGAGLDGNGRPIGEGADPGGPMTASFASIQSHVFTPVCTACHAGGAAPQGLRLDATNSYAMLVGTASAEVPSLKRVAPGDAANSYLIHKLEGHQSVGARMPFGGPYLDANTIGLIRQWIDNGAQQ
ncbi:hypothetical protein LXT12_00940 [Pelomonas sp. P7]|uniref:Cytochrome c domain-containing protein n=1 Tax=Pelomonas caseinilytica TaxID=2906763 RepID=A0ABS8X650_9BURK|nr:hypothetical protein [Pelomonas sp. P7]MCE4535824.1 hypothetical protein [Pelomonas sp. P7]